MNINIFFGVNIDYQGLMILKIMLFLNKKPYLRTDQVSKCTYF